MKLSSLTTIDKIKLAAELDGKKELKQIGVNLYEVPKNFYPAIKVPDYSTSYDAIIPLVQKQSEATRIAMFHNHTHWTAVTALTLSPFQLLDALLIATGKAEL